ncbi:WD40-repeat-containing domain protein, partial [Thamnocephalis sphaerospora]
YQGDGVRIVATCGGDTVCFFDYRLGKPVAKYRRALATSENASSKEDFKCMRWTLLPARLDAGGEQTILAVAGVLGNVLLIQPKRAECYRCLEGHRGAVHAIEFHPQRQSWLFSASADGTIRWWEIGSVDANTSDYGCMAIIGGQSSPIPTALAFADDRMLIGHGDGSVSTFLLADPYKYAAHPTKRISYHSITLQCPAVHHGHVSALVALQDGGFGKYAKR